MSTLASVWGYGLLSARAAASVAGRFYYATDTTLMYRDNGSSWDALSVGTGSMATDTLWDAAGDLAQGTGANTGARLAIGAVGTVLKGGSSAAWGAATSLLLDYALASDISNQAITFDTYFDVFANQNFTVVSATSLIEVVVRGFGFYNDNANDQFLTRINVDSAGTPVIKYLTGVQNTNTTTDSRPNPFAGGSIYISGLTAGVHTIKVQITSLGANNHFYCRASTNGPPTTGSEFLNVQVVEHL